MAAQLLKTAHMRKNLLLASFLILADGRAVVEPGAHRATAWRRWRRRRGRVGPAQGAPADRGGDRRAGGGSSMRGPRERQWCAGESAQGAQACDPGRGV